LTRRKNISAKCYRPEEITSKLREADILIGQGKIVALAIKAIGDADITYYRGRL